MARLLWIIGLSITLIMFGGMVVVCAISLIAHRHLNLTGWTMLLAGIYAVKFIFERLVSAGNMAIQRQVFEWMIYVRMPLRLTDPPSVIHFALE